MRIRVLLNVEVLLHRSLGVAEKRPQGAQGVTELVEIERVVRADDDQPCVGNPELRITVNQVRQKSMLFRVVGPSRQVEDQGVAALEFGELPKRPQPGPGAGSQETSLRRRCLGARPILP